MWYHTRRRDLIFKHLALISLAIREHRGVLCRDNSSPALNDKYSDDTVRYGDATFSTNRVILASRCSYFRLLVFNCMREWRDSVEIDMYNVEPAGFEYLLATPAG